MRLAARQSGKRIALKDYPLHGGKTGEPEFGEGSQWPRAESGAIVWFLTNGTDLQPSDDWSKAQALRWMFFGQYSHEPYVAVARRWLMYETKEALEPKRTLIPEWHARGNAALSVMETHLTHHDWLAGNAYSLADIALYGYTHCADEGGFDLSRYGAVSAWLKRVAAQPNHVRLDESW